MEQEVTRITSFSINHDVLLPGLYVSRVDGDVTTYDMRTRRPNTGDLMDNSTMHSLEHMFATYIRNGDLKDSVVYFGPMGCQTGFYLLVRNADNAEVLRQVRLTLMKILAHEGPVFGASSRECGNYRNLSLAAAKTEAKRYLSEAGRASGDFPIQGVKQHDRYYCGDERGDGISAFLYDGYDDRDHQRHHLCERHAGGQAGRDGGLRHRQSVRGNVRPDDDPALPAGVHRQHGRGGTLSDKLTIGSIAVSSAVVQHDMDTSAIGDPVGLISGINKVQLPADPDLCGQLSACATVLGIRTETGVIASRRPVHLFFRAEGRDRQNLRRDRL